MQKHQSVDLVCNALPAHKIFFFTGEITTAPHGKQIVIGTVAYTLTALKNMLYIGVIKEAFNKITTLPAVLMFRKKRGNFFSMVF